MEFKALEIADGGDGTISALLNLGWKAIEIKVRGPLDNEHLAQIAFNESNGIIAIELAELCGIRWLSGNLQPEKSSTRAIGEALIQIADLPWNELWIGLGGSASNDGGLGILQALGIKVLDRRGREISDSGLSALRRSHRLSEDPRNQIARVIRGRKVKILSDVTAPLLGRFGAIQVFGPQKGLGFYRRISAEVAMRRWSRVVGDEMSSYPGAGAAGGTGFLLMSLFDGEYKSGVEQFLELLEVREKLGPNSLIIAGEGRIDRSSLAGKSVLPILRLARDRGAQVLLICGSADKKVISELEEVFPVRATFALADSGMSERVLMERARELLYDRMVESFRLEWAKK